MVWWWCWLLVTNTVFSVIWLYISLQLSTPPAQTRHSGYTLYTKCPPARNTRCQPLVGSHATRQSMALWILWEMEYWMDENREEKNNCLAHRISFNLTLSKELRNKGMEDEMKIIYECTLEWIMDTHAHCALVRQWGNEASHVRISVPVLFVVYILTIQSEL